MLDVRGVEGHAKRQGAIASKKLVETMIKVGSLANVLMVLTVTAATAQTSVSYVCVEEQSYGWDRGNAGGRFKPSEAKLIVKWLPGKRVELGGEEVGYDLPRIEVSVRGETKPFKSNACDTFARSSLEVYMVLLSVTRDLCIKAGSVPLGPEYYGDEGNHFQFSETLAARPSAMTYVYTRTSVETAYLNRGSCSRIDQ